MYEICLTNTPGTMGGPGGRDRTLAVKIRKTAEKSVFFVKKINLPKKDIFLHISSSYAKKLGETNFHAREIPRSWWKVEARQHTAATTDWPGQNTDSGLVTAVPCFETKGLVWQLVGYNRSTIDMYFKNRLYRRSLVWGHPPLRLSSIEVVLCWGRLPLRLSSV